MGFLEAALACCLASNEDIADMEILRFGLIFQTPSRLIACICFLQTRLTKQCLHLQVVKVMHGADWDVIWLQRDFGIYIASLFDTGQAVRVLSHPRYGLGHMLERLCKVKVRDTFEHCQM